MTQIKKSEFFLLTAILAIAMILRIWGVEFGLPHTYHVDEPTYVSAALNLGAGIIGRQPNPTGFSNILFGEYGVYFLIGRVIGLFNSAADFEQSYRADPTTFMLLGRLTNVALGALNVLLVYWLGREIRGRLIGLLAAWFMAVAFLHVRDSHYAVPDVAMSIFVTLSVLFCVLRVKRSIWWYQYLAAAAGGFAIATKWTALPIVAPLALVDFYNSYGKSGSTKSVTPFRVFNRWIFTTLLLFIGGFLIGGFQLLLQPMAFLNYALREAQAGDVGGFGVWQIDTVPGWVFYLKILSYGLGPVLLGLGILGGLSHLFLAWRTKDKTSILLLAFPLTYYFLMGATRHYFARYTLPLIPFMALFAAEVIATVGAWVGTKRTRLAWGGIAMLVVVASAQPLAQSIQYNVLLTRQDTRTLAKQWIENHLPAGTRIAVDWPVHGPPLSTPERVMPYSEVLYDLTTVGGTGLSDHPVAWYRQQGFDYLVASSFIYNIPLVHEERQLERQAFYTSLERELELVQEFQPYEDDLEPPFIFDEIYGPIVSLWHRERPGPTIKVYKVR